MNKSPKRSWSNLAIITVSALLVMVCMMVVALYRWASEKKLRWQTLQSAQGIVIAIKCYAGDTGGSYPDGLLKMPQTSNRALRRVFQHECADSEAIVNGDEGAYGFGCPNSPFIPDGDIGHSPDYSKALEPGELHWCLVKDVHDSCAGNAPMIFENPNGHTWPPTWNCDVANKPVPGRAWHGGYIMIGRNDGSISFEKLASDKGTHVGLQTNANGQNIFTHWRAKGDFLDVER